LYYYGARYYEPEVGKFYGIDPMTEKYPSIGGMVYCVGNPLNVIDPTGMDWVSAEVDGVTETYYDRTVKSQADANKKYGAKSGVTHLADGTKVADGQYTVHNDHENNKNGVVKDNNGNTVSNNSKPIDGKNFTLFAGTTDNSVNAETLHKNLFGSYTGGDNPQDYLGNDNKDYNPRNSSEQWSIVHDMKYEALGAEGAKGAFLDIRTWKADGYLTVGNMYNMVKPGVPIKDRGRSAATAALFGVITAYKSAITLSIEVLKRAGKGASAIKH
jgi:hypothetical protein